MASVILLSSLFHSKSALADGFPAPSFAAARMSDVGLRPFSVAVNDFNGDSKLDLVVANEGSHPDHDGGGVSVFMSKGDGTFQAGANYGAGTNLSTVAAGDLNGDSKPDLIVAYADGRVSMLLGNGDGTFQVGSNSSAGTNPVFVAVSDFNGDGKLDLAIANSGSDNVSVLLGRGDGTFRAPVGYDAGSGPQFVAVGDFNGDGKLDLTVANMGRYDQSTHEMTNSSVSVLLGKGDGTFQRAINYDEGTNPFSVAVGDFNNDGKLDLAIAHLGSPGSVSVLLSKGDGTFQAGATC